jgi:hypothetical protein
MSVASEIPTAVIGSESADDGPAVVTGRFLRRCAQQTAMRIVVERCACGVGHDPPAGPNWVRRRIGGNGTPFRTVGRLVWDRGSARALSGEQSRGGR